MELLLNELGLNIEELGLVTNTMYSISFDGQSVKIGENVVLPKTTFSNDFLCCFNLRKTLRCVFTKEKMILVRLVELHQHSTYSLLDGANKIKTLIDSCDYSCSLTDHGNMFGMLKFYKGMKDAGKKPIIGFEAYIEGLGEEKLPKSQRSKYHLIVLAKNIEGYRNCLYLCSQAYNNIGGKFPQKPLITHEMLRTHSKGLILLSACAGGEIPKTLMEKGYEAGKELAKLYSSYVEEGDFYFEIQRHNIEVEEKLNPMLIQLSKELGYKLVATTDTHYTREQDTKSHEVLLCINMQKSINEPHYKFEGDGYHLLTADEMEQRFCDIPEVLDNAYEIVEKCNVTIPLGELYLPTFEVPKDFKNDVEYLEYLAWKGFEERFEGKNINEQEYKDRLTYELNTVKNMGFCSYFLIVWDFINYAKTNGIPVGPGRGSAAGSLMSYCLHITNLDPIPYNLLFERFLNPERVSWPDIDVDFCFERRQDVIDYVINKYGEDCVAAISTFGTMAAKMVVRDVARALGRTIATGYSVNLGDIIAKTIPNELKMTLTKALKESPDFKDLYERNRDAKEVIDIAMTLEGNERHQSVHACGVGIAGKNIYDIVSACKSSDSNMWIAQCNMVELEELGVLKMDFLGLKTLTVIDKALKLINPKRKKQGLPTLRYEDIPLNDVEVYKFIATGNTVGVFQLESPGMQNFMKDLYSDIHTVSADMGNQMFERLIAGVSLYRPGPMDSIPLYIKNMQNPDGIEYDTEYLKPILEPTYGCIVYQEQVMRIVRDLAGYSLGRSDLIRRAMGKKKMDVMQKEKHNFIYGLPEEGVPGCLSKGISEEVSIKIFDDMIDFAKYAFNKSHAAVYAMLAVITAWLKYYYPVEFAVGILNTYIGTTKDLKYYIADVKKQNIKILPPSVNHSEEFFTKEGENIRFGLKGLKGINNCNDILEERKNGLFESFEDMISRLTKYDKVNKRFFEALTYASALDVFEGTRAAKIEIIPKLLEASSKDRKTNIAGQLSMFEVFSEVVERPHIEMPNIPEFDKKTKLLKEKEYSNLYLTEHPLDDYIPIMKSEKIMDIGNFKVDESLEQDEKDSILNSFDGEKVKFAGIVTEKKKIFTKKGDVMYTFILEDLSGELKTVVFPKQLQKIDSSLIDDENVVVVEGNLQYGDYGLQVIVDNLIPIENLKKHENVTRVWVLLNNSAQVQQVKVFAKKYSGDTPLYAKIKIGQNEEKVLIGNISWTLGSINSLKNITNFIHTVIK